MSWAFLDDFEIKEILNYCEFEKKIIYLIEEKNKKEWGILILWKDIFDIKKNIDFKNIKGEIFFKNDIYTKANSDINEFKNIKMELIYPVNQLIVEKYRKIECVVIEETSEIYKNKTLKFINEFHSQRINWIDNIFDKKSEQESIIIHNNNFVFLPDYKDNKGENFHYLLIFKNEKSWRDLNGNNIDQINNIYNECLDKLEEKFNIKKNLVFSYFHYPPSFYQLHIHWVNCNSVSYSIMGNRFHIYNNVYQNIKMNPNYYQEISLYYNLKTSSKLYEIINE